MASLPRRLLQWARSPFVSERGLHADIFRAACLLIEEGFTEEESMRHLRAAAAQVRERSVPEREIAAAFRCARFKVETGAPPGPIWPPVSPALRQEVITRAPVNLSLRVWKERPTNQDAGHWLMQLFRPEEFVCVAWAANEPITRRAGELEKLVRELAPQFLVPQPMLALEGLTKEGRLSAHAESNTAPRRRLVIEFDTGTGSEHLAILWHLAASARLLLAVHSGGKSVHGWFDVAGWPEWSVIDFFARAVRLGADPKMFSRTQYTRMPGGFNVERQKPQSVLFYAEPAQ